MSLKLPLKLVSLFLFFLISFYSLHVIFSKTTPIAEKSIHFNQSAFTSRGRVDRIIQIKIQNASFKTMAADGSLKITAWVTLPFDFNDPVEYLWKLGPHVTLTSGSLSGQLKNFLQNQPQKIEIFVKGFISEENRHIGFEASAIKNERRLYSDSLISSQFEKSFEYKVQNIERLKREQIGKPH